MNNTSPFSFLESIVSRFQPPAWVVDEGQHRLVLFLNHVLMQEKQAQDRLLRQKGRVVHARWGVFAMDLIVTPAGLVDRALASAKPVVKRRKEKGNDEHDNARTYPAMPSDGASRANSSVTD
jgi:ubiquinone biosynthesis protein UbiJ